MALKRAHVKRVQQALHRLAAYDLQAYLTCDHPKMQEVHTYFYVCVPMGKKENKYGIYTYLLHHFLWGGYSFDPDFFSTPEIPTLELRMLLSSI